MIDIKEVEKHIKTHSERSDDDKAAVITLDYFLKSNGRIITSFNSNDKYPNIDGYFQLVPNPEIDRRPVQNFVVQIKSSNHIMNDSDETLEYRLKSLAFPAYALKEVTLDPCILFVVINANNENKSDRVFWKYLSVEFLSSIDYSKESVSIKFSKEDEIFKTSKSLDLFVDKLIEIEATHSFIRKLQDMSINQDEAIKIIKKSDMLIKESIERLDVYNDTRDNISKRMLNELYDLCCATLIINAISKGYETPSIGLAWQVAIQDIKTKFLSTFLEELKYINRRIPADGQSERLMLKFYHYLWQIRQYLKDYFKIYVLDNLEKFPLNQEKEDLAFYNEVAKVIEKEKTNIAGFNNSRYYIERKTPFFIGKERYFEITLQLAGKYASKFNRLTIYTQKDISSNYSIQISYIESKIQLWGNAHEADIKIALDWKVSIDPSVLNKFSSIFYKNLKLSSSYGEYSSLMNFLTQTGMSLLDLIDLNSEYFVRMIKRIYEKNKTSYFKDIIELIRKNYDLRSTKKGKNIVRYLLLHLKEECVDGSIYNEDGKEGFKKSSNLFLNNSCYPFDSRPFLYNPPKSKINNKNISQEIIRAVGNNCLDLYLPYIRLKSIVEYTGEIYINKELVCLKDSDYEIISNYNKSLSAYDKSEGFEIRERNNQFYLASYETHTISIMNCLKEYEKSGNEGQKFLNEKYIEKKGDNLNQDQIKKMAIKNIFIKGKIFAIYGAAGTGKTTLMDHISQLMDDSSKLFLAKTHTAKVNLEKRISNTKGDCVFETLDKFLKNNTKVDYDIVFIDECSTIDNRTMFRLTRILNMNSLLVLAGDTYQIESIDFGNWFYYAKSLLNKNSVVELTNTWRTNEPNIITLWDEVRKNGDLISVKLAMDGPFSERITNNLFKERDTKGIVLCLNYDGRFGLNNINNYFQDTNENKSFTWHEWKYKKDDPILFNDSARFPMLYNNLKGSIVDIKKDEKSITFTIEIDKILTGVSVRNSDLVIIEYTDRNTTIVQFTIYENEGGVTDEDREISKLRSIVPFQVAYAVSIHKSQGLEYDSVRIVIPSCNAETVTHGVFYTAITRARSKLKIFWSPETMQKVILGFNNHKTCDSLNIIKGLLTNI